MIKITIVSDGVIREFVTEAFSEQEDEDGYRLWIATQPLPPPQAQAASQADAPTFELATLPALAGKELPKPMSTQPVARFDKTPPQPPCAIACDSGERDDALSKVLSLIRGSGQRLRASTGRSR